MWVRRQAGESLLCGKDNRDTGEEGEEKKQPETTKACKRPTKASLPSRWELQVILWTNITNNYIFKSNLQGHLTCPAEFSITWTSGGLVDIFEGVSVAKKIKMEKEPWN